MTDSRLSVGFSSLRPENGEKENAKGIVLAADKNAALCLELFPQAYQEDSKYVAPLSASNR